MHTLIVTLFSLGALVILGWQTGWEEVTSFGFTTPMMPSTAMCFMLTAVTLATYKTKELVCAWSILCTTALMACILGEAAVDVSFGFAKVLTTDKIQSISEAHGEPSIVTCLSFLALSGAGWKALQTGDGSKLISWIVGFIGVFGLVGHFIDVPYMYYQFEGVSTAMSPGTCLAFIVSGLTTKVAFER